MNRDEKLYVCVSGGVPTVISENGEETENVVLIDYDVEAEGVCPVCGMEEFDCDYLCPVCGYDSNANFHGQAVRARQYYEKKLELLGPPPWYEQTPAPGEYVQLLDGQGRPCENHTTVEALHDAGIWDDGDGRNIWEISDLSGEHYTVIRNPTMDTAERRAWLEFPA